MQAFRFSHRPTGLVRVYRVGYSHSHLPVICSHPPPLRFHPPYRTTSLQRIASAMQSFRCPRLRHGTPAPANS
eukprot:622786-Prorocentrum_minimum.AAC.2